MSTLEITEVRVRPYSKNDDKLKAFATLTFNQCFVVTDLKVIRGKKGLFVAMPSRKRKDGKFKDVAHPLNNETRDMIEKTILEEYEKVLSRGPIDLGKNNSSMQEEPPNGEVEDEFKDV
jgi:stage V sporulation protein G